MKNQTQEGDILTLTAPTGGATGGAAVVIGSIVGVAFADAAEGEDVVVKRCGVFSLTKASTQVWAEGAEIYVTAGGQATTSSSGNTRIGVAAAAAPNPSATGQVLFTGQTY